MLQSAEIGGVVMSLRSKLKFLLVSYILGLALLLFGLMFPGALMLTVVSILFLLIK